MNGATKTADSRKTYVLDTSVLVHDPDCVGELDPQKNPGVFGKFEEHDIVVPFQVIEELDDLKVGRNELRAEAAREALRHLEAIRQKANAEGSTLARGVNLGNGRGTLYVFTERITPKLGLDLTSRFKCTDNLLIEIANWYRREKKQKAIVLSKDTAVKIKADSFDVPAEDYLGERKKGIKLDEIVNLHQTVLVPGDMVDALYSPKRDSPLEIPESARPLVLYHNQYLLLADEQNPEQHIALVKHLKDGIVQRISYPERFEGITPKNVRQKFAADLLFDENIRLGAFIGKAGTGKTLLAIAAALEQTTGNNPKYSKVIVVRPTITMDSNGDGPGALPGDLEEKEEPYMSPIYDALGLMLNAEKSGTRKNEKPWQRLIDAGQLQLGTVRFIRGRSIHNAYIIVDDAQNLSPWHIKALSTRPAESTKMIFVGDFTQIDDKYLNRETCGISHLARRVLGEDYFGVVYLVKGERSRVADRLADLL